VGAFTALGADLIGYNLRNTPIVGIFSNWTRGVSVRCPSRWVGPGGNIKSRLARDAQTLARNAHEETWGE
jgi:hypothetical protein